MASIVRSSGCAPLFDIALLVQPVNDGSSSQIAALASEGALFATVYGVAYDPAPEGILQACLAVVDELVTTAKVSSPTSHQRLSWQRHTY